MAKTKSQSSACSCGQVVFDLSTKKTKQVVICPWCGKRYRVTAEHKLKALKGGASVRRSSASPEAPVRKAAATKKESAEAAQAPAKPAVKKVKPPKPPKPSDASGKVKPRADDSPASTVKKKKERKKKKKKKKKCSESLEKITSADTAPLPDPKQLEKAVQEAALEKLEDLEELVEIGAGEGAPSGDSQYSLDGAAVDLNGAIKDAKRSGLTEQETDAGLVGGTHQAVLISTGSSFSHRNRPSRERLDEALPLPKPFEWNLEKLVIYMFVLAVPVGAIAFAIYMAWGIKRGLYQFQSYHILGLTIHGNDPWVWVGGILAGALLFFLLWVGYTYLFVFQKETKGARRQEEDENGEAGPPNHERPGRTSRRRFGSSTNDP